MKKIAIVGLYSIPNMGDKILCEASQYLTKELSSEFEIREVDVCPRYASDYHGLEYIKYRISRKLKTHAEKKFVYEDSSTYRYRYEYFMWWLRLNRYYKKMLSDVDAILFAGGGFLKFRTQGLNYYVEQIIKIAKEHNIPVMMNGVGIEGYDDNDIRCQKLKEIINSDCVKTITTRDDIETLNNNYITNPNIKTSRVGDPALWTPECYQIARSETPARIGINLIRGKVFKDYGNTCSPDQLKEFYKQLITAAENKGLDWVLFSNGMKSDQKFGKIILKELEISPEEKLLPAPKTSLELLDMVKEFKCIFGARLHACITAYSLDVPVVGFIWNEKTRFFAEIIDKKENFFEETEMDAENILNQMLKAADSTYNTDIRNNLKDLTSSYLEDFLKQI